MFDTTEEDDPIDRIIAHAGEVLFAENKSQRFTGGNLTVGMNLLLAASRLLDDDDNIISAYAELVDCDLRGDTGERSEDALAEWEDAAANVYVKYREMFEVAS